MTRTGKSVTSACEAQHTHRGHDQYARITVRVGPHERLGRSVGHALAADHELFAYWPGVCAGVRDASHALGTLAARVTVLDAVVRPVDSARRSFQRATARAVALAQEQCERAAEALATKALARARALVPKGGGGFRTREEVARRLGLSVRTLERRLAEGGASYRGLLEGARRERAEAMLRARASSVEAIAEALGYSDAANFTRAFRRWTGATPAAWRKALG